MKTVFLAVCFALSSICYCQTFYEGSVGMTSRLGISVTGNIGYGSLDRAYSGLTGFMTANIEAGFGANYGAAIGFQTYVLQFYAGLTKFESLNSKLVEGSRIYPMAGIQYRWPQNRAIADLRYMGDSFHLTIGFRFGKGHDE